MRHSSLMVKVNQRKAKQIVGRSVLKKTILTLLCLTVLGDLTYSAEVPDVPDVLRDGDEHERGELGVNEFTAPSINRIFSDLQKLPEIPPALAKREIPEKLPLDRPRLAMELGGLIADGFLCVQTNQMDLIRPLAMQLSRYSKAIGAGERVSRHGANLLKHAENKQLESLKRDLAQTQRDVEAELLALQDPDMAHLIGLGGWIRALDIATQVLEKKFDPAKAKIVFQAEIPEYFNEALAGLDPTLYNRDDITEIRGLLAMLENAMDLKDQEPKLEQIRKIQEMAAKLAKKTILR